MALIKCPNCGNQISDQAQRCIHCGYSFEMMESRVCIECGALVPANADICPNCGYPLGKMNVTPDSEAENTDSNDKSLISERTLLSGRIKDTAGKLKRFSETKSGKIVLGIILGTFLLAAIMLFKPSGQFTKVNGVDIERWTLVDEDDYDCEYKAVLSSETKQPFVAVLKNVTNGYASDYVCMENGEGVLEKTIYDTEDDPSDDYQPYAYLTGKKVNDGFFSSIKVTTDDFNDYNSLEETTFDAHVSVKLKTKQDGLLFVDLSNDINSMVSHNCIIPIVDGEGKSSYYMDGFPLKTRGVDVIVEPRLFCLAAPLKGSDYEIEDDYTVTRDSTDYHTTYKGSEVLRFADSYEDGLVIYTSELLSGGQKEYRGVVLNEFTHLKNHRCEIVTYDSNWDDDHKSLKEPSYSLEVKSYMNINVFDD